MSFAIAGVSYRDLSKGQFLTTDSPFSYVDMPPQKDVG